MSATYQRSRFCKACNRQTLHVKHAMSTGSAVVITVFTAGLFLLFWLPYCWIILPLTPYRCQRCGRGRRL